MSDERTTQYDYCTNHEQEKKNEQNNGAEEHNVRMTLMGIITHDHVR